MKQIAGKMCKPQIIVSAINFTSGGPLAVLCDCLRNLHENWSGQYDIVAMVNSKNSIRVEGIEYLEFPMSRKSWLFRLYYEYFAFKKVSKRLRPRLWLSLHDTSPFLSGCKQVVYCHNPSPFYRPGLKELFFQPSFVLFTYFYKYLYRINIHSNIYVIVQQQWQRKEFQRRFNLKNNVIVARPAVEYLNASKDAPVKNGNAKKTFIYPCLPRVFKNFELICQASKMLWQRGINNFEVTLTIDGTESRYSRWVYKKYKDVPTLNFVGLKSREQVFEYYRYADAMIFASKLETWGMPITEFIQYDKPVLLANLEYAHETVGAYNKVSFFDPDSPSDLAKLMEDFLNGSITYESTAEVKLEQPYAANWEELFDILLRQNG